MGSSSTDKEAPNGTNGPCQGGREVWDAAHRNRACSRRRSSQRSHGDPPPPSPLTVGVYLWAFILVESKCRP